MTLSYSHLAKQFYWYHNFVYVGIIVFKSLLIELDYSDRSFRQILHDIHYHLHNMAIFESLKHTTQLAAFFFKAVYHHSRWIQVKLVNSVPKDFMVLQNSMTKILQYGSFQVSRKLATSSNQLQTFFALFHSDDKTAIRAIQKYLMCS